MKSFLPTSTKFLIFCGNSLKSAYFTPNFILLPLYSTFLSLLSFSACFNIIYKVRKSFNWLDFFYLPFDVLDCLYVEDILKNESDKLDSNTNWVLLMIMAKLG